MINKTMMAETSLPKPAFDKARLISQLRERRKSECFSVVNRGLLWYMMLSDEQHAELNRWYAAWLDVTETLIVPDAPEWLNKKLNNDEVIL